MSVDGILIGDVRRMCAIGGLPCCFLVTGLKGWGKTSALRSFVTGMESVGGVVQVSSSHHSASVSSSTPSVRANRADKINTKETYWLRLLQHSNLDAMAPVLDASDEDVTQDASPCPPILYVVDDLDVLWSLCRLNGRTALLTQILGTLLRSRRCALVASAASVQRVPNLARTRSPVLTYSLPRLTAAAACRMLRVLRGINCQPDVTELGAVAVVSEVIRGHDCSRTMLTMATCAAQPRHAVEPPSCVIKDAHHVLGDVLRWLMYHRGDRDGRDDGDGGSVVGGTPTLTEQASSSSRATPFASRGRLYGLEEVYARLAMMMSILTGSASQCAREWGGCDSAANRRESAISGGKVLASLPCTTGILLHGPSGCGKRALTRQLATDFVGVSFLFVECTQLFSKYLGESEERLRQVYRRARDRRPAVVVLNNIDVVAHTRGAVQQAGRDGGKGVDVHRRMLAVLLCELDGVTDNAGVLTIGISGAMHVIDTALLRQGRLETILHVPPLTQRAAEDMVSDFFARFARTKEDGAESNLVSQIAAHAVGCTPAALRYLLRKLFEAALQDDSNDVTAPPTPSKTTINALLLKHVSVLQRVG